MTDDRTRYESHTWSPLTDDDEDECVVCGVTWGACEDECPGLAEPEVTDPRSASEMASDVERARDLLMAQTYQPDPSHALMTEALNSAEETGRTKERRRWLLWLDAIAYGIDLITDPTPPCTRRELAEVMQETNPIDDEPEPVAVYEAILRDELGWNA